MKKRKKENEKIINVDKKSTNDVKMKKIVEKEFSKEKENFDTMMFEIVDVKNSNIKFFIKYHINDTTTISNSFTKFSFELENFSEEENATQAHEKKQKKKKNSKKNENESFEKTEKKRQMSEFLFFV